MGNRVWRLALLLSFFSFLLIFNLNCAHTQTHAQTRTIHPNRNINSIDPDSKTDGSVKKGISLIWPMAKHRISQFFKHDDHENLHEGIDIPAPRGTRIYAPADGKIVYAGHKFHGYGKMILMEHSKAVATLYGHCQKLLVKSGEFVKRGTLIGLVGRTGRASAPHLHFEVRLNKEPVNPMEYLP